MWVHDMMMLAEAAFRELAVGMGTQVCFGAGLSPKGTVLHSQVADPQTGCTILFPNTAALAPGLSPEDGSTATTATCW